MDNRRMFLLAALGLVGYLIFNAWMQDYGQAQRRAAPTRPAVTQNAQPAPATSSSQMPAPASATPAAPTTQQPQIAGATKLVNGRTVLVTTDVLQVKINTAGGDLRAVALPKYPQTEAKNSPPVELLHPDPSQRLILQTGLNGARLPSDQATFTAAAGAYHLQPGQDTLKVPLVWRHDGITVIKTYTFHRGSYKVDLTYRIANASGAPISGSTWARFRRHAVPVSHNMFSIAARTYSGPALFNGNDYNKLQYDDIKDKPVSKIATGGWVAMVNQYFVAAVIPPAKMKVHYYAKALGGDRYVIGAVLPKFSVAPGQEYRRQSLLFLGPKLQDRLASVAPGLPRTVDYGKFTIIAQPMFKVLEAIESVVGNWGWSILLLVFLIQLVFFPLQQKAGRSTAKMREFQPRIKAIQERYKDDKQRLSQAMMELYKKEKINPMGGCLPMLLQVPLYFALYYVLLYSVELRHAPFVFWLTDLSAPDPLYVLPILYGIANFAQMRVNPQPADKMQARIMMVMPLGVMAFSFFMPAGLVLYWISNAVLRTAQQWHINRTLHLPGQARKKPGKIKKR
ncbi:MAG TPA: membrane protein insertase YidC [Gammaproteobacteria bacterium]|nr:membrane protein insertase YidC [Gammaproteobacteria bacterium]